MRAGQRWAVPRAFIATQADAPASMSLKEAIAWAKGWNAAMQAAPGVPGIVAAAVPLQQSSGRRYRRRRPTNDVSIQRGPS